MHLVSCRNLLIYMDAALQRRVLPSFHFALLPEGALMLGMSESIGTFAEVFAPLETRRGRVFVKKPVPARQAAAVIPLHPAGANPIRSEAPDSVRRTAPPNAAAGSGRSSSGRLMEEFERILLDRYSPACVLCDEDLNIVQYRGDTSPFLSNPPGPPTHQLRRLARAEVFPGHQRRHGRSSKGRCRRPSRTRARGVEGETLFVNLDVVPVQPPEVDARWYIVICHRGAEGRPNGEVPMPSARSSPIWHSLAARFNRSESLSEAALTEEVARLNEELRVTLEQIRDMLEDRNRELHELQETVSQARDYADAVLETMAEPPVVLDQNMRVSRANRAFYDAFRTTPRDTLHCELYRLCSQQWDVPALRTLLGELLPKHTEIA